MQKRKQWAVDINVHTHLGLPINCLLLWQLAYIKYPMYCIFSLNAWTVRVTDINEYQPASHLYAAALHFYSWKI